MSRASNCSCCNAKADDERGWWCYACLKKFEEFGKSWQAARAQKFLNQRDEAVQKLRAEREARVVLNYMVDGRFSDKQREQDIQTVAGFILGWWPGLEDGLSWPEAAEDPESHDGWAAAKRLVFSSEKPKRP